MLCGRVIADYAIGPILDQKKYYEIYASRNTMDGNVFSLKIENAKSVKKVLTDEFFVLDKLGGAQYIPKLYDHRCNDEFCWSAIDLIGPSLADALTYSRRGRFMVDTSLRVSLHIFKMIKLLHLNRFLLRGLSLNNIHIGLSPGAPICVSDLSDAREYRDPSTRVLVPPESSFGALDINKYSSINVHNKTDFSRRDDLISWFYMTLDLLVGLPWGDCADLDEMLALKKGYDVEQNIRDRFPELVDIWNYLLILKYYDEPDYELIEARVLRCMESKGCSESNAFDWDDFLNAYKSNLSSEFGIKFDKRVFDMQIPMTELGVPGAIVRLTSSSFIAPSPGPSIFIGGSNQTKSYCC